MSILSRVTEMCTFSFRLATAVTLWGACGATAVWGAATSAVCGARVPGGARGWRETSRTISTGTVTSSRVGIVTAPAGKGEFLNGMMWAIEQDVHIARLALELIFPFPQKI